MFNDIFNCYYEIYEDLLDGFYPAKHSTGFQERNLSGTLINRHNRLY